MTRRRLILSAVLTGILVTVGLAGAAPPKAAMGAPRAPLTTTGPAAFNVAVDESTGHVFVLSSQVDSGDMAGAPFADGYVSMLDAASGRLLRTVAVGSAPFALALDSPAQRLFVAKTAGGLAVLDTRTGALLRSILVKDRYQPTIAGSLGVAVDARAERLFMVDARGVLMVSTRTGRVVRTIPGVAAGAAGVACSCIPGADMAVDDVTGHLFLMALPGGTAVTMVDVVTGIKQRTEPLPGTGVGLVVDPASGQLLVETVDRRASHLVVLDGRTAATRASVTLPGVVYPGAAQASRIAPDLRAGMAVDGVTGRAFILRGTTQRSGYVPRGPGRMVAVEARTGRVLPIITIAANPVAAAVDARAGRLVVASTREVVAGTVLHDVSVVTVIDTATERTIHVLPVHGMTASLFVASPLALDTATGRAFVLDWWHNRVSVINDRSGQLVRNVALQPRPVLDGPY